MNVKFSLNDTSESERAFAPEVNSASEEKIWISEEEAMNQHNVLNTESIIENKFPMFEKVPFEQFKIDCKKLFDNADDNIIKTIYDNISIPTRATPGSAGYDFRIPFEFSLIKDSSVVIPTGLRCKMPKNLVLLLVPRSGLGFKYRLSLMNTVGVIDSDYYSSDNFGHIMIKIIYDGDNKSSIIKFNNMRKDDSIDDIIVTTIRKGNPNTIRNDLPLVFKINQGFAQGIFINYCVTANEILNNDEKNMKRRIGGIGSTTK